MSYAEKFVEVLDKNELNHSEIKRSDGADYVQFGMRGDNTNVGVVVFFPDDSNRVSVRCFKFVENVPDAKYADVLMCCNQLNDEYNFVKFVLDEDSDVTLREDAFIDEETGGDETFGLCITMINIADEVYPRIMKTLWG